MKVLVFGLGRSGLAVSRLLLHQGHEVVAFDERLKSEDRESLESSGGRVTLKPSNESIDLCIAAPGVPIDHPALEALRKRDIEVIGEVEWVYRSVDAPILGVTGTAGKTTTTRWLTDVLIGAGLQAVAGGNIDPALAAVAEEDTYLVTELSSFQLERCPTLKPRIATVLNLGVDHLDRHGTVEKYHQTKYAVTQNQMADDLFIYNADEPVLSEWAAKSRARTKGFSVAGKADARLIEHNGTTHLYLDGEPLLAADDLHLSGQHQWGNALAVALAAADLGVSREAIAKGLADFTGVAGRYAPVATLGGVTFVEDSIATRTLSVRAALEATPYPIVWLAGGADKGADLASLQDLVREKVTLLVGVGEAGERFARAFEATSYVCSQKDGAAALRCACEQGLGHLRKRHTGKGTVLLAPLAASFDQFKDYKDRAETFRQVVTQLATREATQGDVRESEGAWTPC